MSLQTVTGPELRARLKAQEVSREHLAVKCPMCGTVQSAFDLIRAGAGADFDAVAKHLGVDCVGRFTGAAAPRREKDGQPCNWTLHGMLQLHTFEVLEEDGQRYPFFEPAAPGEAQENMRKSMLMDADKPRTAMTFNEFIAEAARLNLTAADLAGPLSHRPEFKDAGG